MTKQRVTLTLDSDTYVLLKSAGVNISELATKLFNSYLATGDSHQDEAKILEQLQEAKERLEQSRDEVQLLSVTLVHLRETKEKENREYLNLANEEIQAQKAAGILMEVGR